EWGVREGSREEVQSYFQDCCRRARQLIDLPKSWKRWATADREPIDQWTFGRTTLLGDAAHPTLQYIAQGACMALEDAVTLGQALKHCEQDWPASLQLYERSRIARTARVVLSAREMGRIFHAKGVERLVRNDLWKGRSPERFYDAMEWLYGWTAETSLAKD
ncbi:MAG: FAD-dependent monooxygenase, partial [Comamonas sp.]